MILGVALAAMFATQMAHAGPITSYIGAPIGTTLSQDLYDTHSYGTVNPELQTGFTVKANWADWNGSAWQYNGLLQVLVWTDTFTNHSDITSIVFDIGNGNSWTVWEPGTSIQFWEMDASDVASIQNGDWTMTMNAPSFEGGAWIVPEPEPIASVPEPSGALFVGLFGVALMAFGTIHTQRRLQRA